MDCSWTLNGTLNAILVVIIILTMIMAGQLMATLMATRASSLRFCYAPLTELLSCIILVFFTLVNITENLSLRCTSTVEASQDPELTRKSEECTTETS